MSIERGPLEWAISPILKYAQFSGRAPRAEYWWFTLATTIVGLVISVIDNAAGSKIGFLVIAFNLALLIPSISVAVRRLHDTNRTGWWMLPPILSGAVFGFFAVQESLAETFEAKEPTSLHLASILVFVVSTFLLTIFMILRGTRGANRFGPDPYGGRPQEIESDD